MSKDLGLTIAAGMASALVFFSVLSGGSVSIPLVYLSPLPLTLIGLAYGAKRAAIGSILACGLLALARPSAVGIFAVVVVLPVAVLAVQATWRLNRRDGTREWYPPGSILAWFGLCATGLMILGALLLPGQESGIESEARRYVAHFLDQVAVVAPADVKESVIGLWSALFPAMLGGAWLAIAILSGVLGQAIVTKAGLALRPTPAYALLDLPLWLLVPLAGAAGIGLMAGGDAGYLGRNAAVVLLLPHVFTGLAVVHRGLSGRPNASAMLAGFYVAFFVLFGWALMAVAGLGLVRHWTRLQRQGAGCSQEEK